jgi:hypothetical protein
LLLGVIFRVTVTLAAVFDRLRLLLSSAGAATINAVGTAASNALSAAGTALWACRARYSHRFCPEGKFVGGSRR